MSAGEELQTLLEDAERELDGWGARTDVWIALERWRARISLGCIAGAALAVALSAFGERWSVAILPVAIALGIAWARCDGRAMDAKVRAAEARGRYLAIRDRFDRRFREACETERTSGVWSLGDAS